MLQQVGTKKIDRWKMFNTFVDETRRRLQHSEASVWTILFRDARGDLASTGYAGMATRGGMSKSTVARAIRQLKEKGLLVVRKPGKRDNNVTQYQIFSDIDYERASRHAEHQRKPR